MKERQMVLVAIVGSVIIIAMLSFLAVLVFTRGIDFRPDPAVVARSYLEAISSGDTEAATKLFDPVSIRPDEIFVSADQTTMMTDAALSGATKRITDIEIIPTSTVPTHEISQVFFPYTLDVVRYPNESVLLRWTGKQ